jgi:N-methylhydantoinase A/acetophenone carboxylase
MGITISIDTGGSFTDGFFTSGVRVEHIKVDTTPHDLTVCFLNCIEEGAGRLGLQVRELLSHTEIIRYATTIGTNCLLQRKGPKLGLITTLGFAEEVFALSPGGDGSGDAGLLGELLPPAMRRELAEEIKASGAVMRPVEEEEVRQAVEHLLDAGARSIVISLKNSAANCAHEDTAKGVIDAEFPRHYLGSVPVLTAGAITAHSDSRVRTNTAVLNAYIHRDMVRYLYRAEDMLRNRGYRRPLLVTHSSGGAARVAKTTALNTYNSGPVAGFVGCSKIASELYGIQDFVSVDVGGTSVDIGIATGGRVAPEREPDIEGTRIGLPMVTLGTAAGGGGTIATMNGGSAAIEVGPDSAGALPGPASYDLGGMEPTITDADLVLGYLDPDYFLGGRKILARDKAIAAIDSLIAGPLGASVEKAAWQIIQRSEDNVAQQVAERIERADLAADTLTLFAFGGGGGTRCCGYASRLGISRVIVFAFNAVASAFGASTMDIFHTYERSANITLRSHDGNHPSEHWATLNDLVAEMVSSAERDMRGEGFAPEDLAFTLELGFRGAAGTIWSETTPVRIEQEEDARALCRLSDAGGAPGSGQAVIERVGLKAICPVPHHCLPAFSDAGLDPSGARKGSRNVYWGSGHTMTDIYERDLLKCGNRVEGPAIIEAPDTTYAVPAGWSYTVDQYLNGILEART